jgi:predicted HTH domain antitoxin
VKAVAKAQKTISIRMDADDHSFLNLLAAEEKENISQAVRELVGRGRVMLAVERYRAGKVSLGKAAEIAGLSISETLDILIQYGVPANLDPNDYLQSLGHLKKAW